MKLPVYAVRLIGFLIFILVVVLAAVGVCRLLTKLQVDDLFTVRNETIENIVEIAGTVEAV